MEKIPKTKDSREEFIKNSEIIWEDLLHEEEGICEQATQDMIDNNTVTLDEVRQLLIDWSKSNSQKYIAEIEGKSAYIGGGIQEGKDDRILQGWLWVLKRLQALSEKYVVSEVTQASIDEAREKIFSKYPYAQNLEAKSYFS